ncbi:MAG: smpB [Dehalococcoidia bacterium]|nr:smpB [Dehalococcoidia bacterium]
MATTPRSKAKDPGRVITVNRRAYHDYDILETVEAGLVLTGTEIKSVRAGQVNIRHAFARAEGGEIWLYGAHIALYPQGNVHNHEPTRTRKLLLRKEQIGELAGSVAQKGLTLIPLRVYIKNHVAKVELGLARGRKLYDKRRAIIDQDQEREAGQVMRQASRE